MIALAVELVGFFILVLIMPNTEVSVEISNAILIGLFVQTVLTILFKKPKNYV